MTNLTPVYINVYDLTEYNNYIYWFGLGIYHSGIEIHGVEYGFGAHDYPSSGVFEVEPRNTPGFHYRTTVLVGMTSLTPDEIKVYIQEVSNEYHGDTYHLIVKNCNHFTSDVSMRLVGKSIPGYVNRMARLGWWFNCLLPESLRVDAVKSTPEYHTFEDEEALESPAARDRQDLRLLTPPDAELQSQSRERLRDTTVKRQSNNNALHPY